MAAVHEKKTVGVLREGYRNLIVTGKNRVVREVATISFGHVVGLVLMLGFTPILSRIYTPEAFGSLATFTAVLVILGVLAAGRLELAVPIPDAPDEAAALAGLGLLVSIIFALAGTVLLLATNWLPLAAVAGAPRWWLLLPPAIGLFGANQILNYWQTRNRRYASISWATILRSVAASVTQIGFGVWLLASPGYLVVGFVAGLFLETAVLAAGAAPTGLPRLLRTVRPPDLRRAFRVHRDFLRFGTGQAILNAVSQNTVVIVLATVFRADVAGWYSLAYRVLVAPIYLLGRGIRQVYYERFCRAGTAAQRLSQWRRATGLLALAGIPLTVVVIVAGPAVFTKLFGDQWHASGLYARALAPSLYLVLLNQPSVMSIPVLGRQRQHLFFEAGQFVGSAACLVAGGVLKSPLVAIIGFSAVGVVVNSWLIFYVGEALRRARNAETG